MRRKGMVLLVGEQPAPNLLPVRHERPQDALLVYTRRTKRIATNLRKILGEDCVCSELETDPYSISGIHQTLRQRLSESDLAAIDWLFNITGGTKPMAIAALWLAQERGEQVLYFQTEGRVSKLYYYRFTQAGPSLETEKQLVAKVSVEDLLRMHAGGYKEGWPRNRFESAVADVLRGSPKIEEAKFSVTLPGEAALEIDFIVRCGDRFGVGEVKTQADKSGIDQLQAAAEQRHLGTYIAKFLVSGAPVDRNNLELAKAYRIDVIETRFAERRELEEEDRALLERTILTRLGCR